MFLFAGGIKGTEGLRSNPGETDIWEKDVLYLRVLIPFRSTDELSVFTDS